LLHPRYLDSLAKLIGSKRSKGRAQPGDPARVAACFGRAPKRERMGHRGVVSGE
jgi:hypothetical protein